MKLVIALFATALAMCVVVGIALLVPEVADGHGFEHPDHPSMSQAPPGLERHQGVLWLGWALGILEIAFFGGAMALGARKGEDLRGLGKPLLWGSVAYAVMWTLLVLAYRAYVTDDAPSLFLALPLPTALFLYGLFPLPVCFAVFFCVGYKRWIFTDGDLREYELLLANKRRREATEKEPAEEPV